MRILVVSSTVFACPPSGYSGLEMIAWQQADGLVKKGHQVTLIAPQGSVLPGGSVIAPFPPGQADERMVYEKTWQELPKHDCIVDHSWQKYAYLLKAEGKLKSPVLSWLHAPVNTMMQSLPPVEKPCMVCISEDQRAHLEALFAPAQARTCYNGIDAPGFYKPIQLPRTRRFLFLARFSTVKGPDISIDVCRKAGVELDLVGDTKLTGEAEFLQSIIGKGDGKQIRFVGPATRGNCVWWYGQAHAMVHHNSRFREPYGLAPVEAQACGLPVCAWDFGAMRETVQHGKTGLLCHNFDEAIEHVKMMANLSDKEMKDIRQNCVDNAQKFTVQKMVDRVESLCNEAVEKGGW